VFSCIWLADEAFYFEINQYSVLIPSLALFIFNLPFWLHKGNIKKVDKNENPTEYRSPTTYVDLVQANTLTEDDQQYGFELVFARPNRTYIEVR
jgi:hypothetical protein